MEGGILSKLSDYLFWDCDKYLLDPVIDRSLILERVYSLGTENDEREALNYYGTDTVKNTVLNIKYLDKKTLNYLSIVFYIQNEMNNYNKSVIGKYNAG